MAFSSPFPSMETEFSTQRNGQSMSTRKEQAAETREKLIRAAVDILNEVGGNTLSANHLASRAGVSKGTVFHHFGDMNGVWLGILDHLVEAHDERIQQRGYSDLRSFFFSMIEAAFEVSDRYHFVFTSLIHFARDGRQNTEFRERLQTWGAKLYADWKDHLFMYVKREIPEERKERIVRMIDIYFSGLRVHKLLCEEPETLQHTTEDFMEILLQYLEG